MPAIPCVAEMRCRNHPGRAADRLARQREDGKAIAAVLDKHGVATGLDYPLPLHLQPGFAELDLGPGLCPHTERAAEQIVSLPMYPHLTREQVAYVAARLRQAVQETLQQ